MRYFSLTPQEKQSCTKYCGRFAANIVQEVGEKYLFPRHEWEAGSLPRYASQIFPIYR